MLFQHVEICFDIVTTELTCHLHVLTIYVGKTAQHGYGMLTGFNIVVLSSIIKVEARAMLSTMLCRHDNNIVHASLYCCDNLLTSWNGRHVHNSGYRCSININFLQSNSHQQPSSFIIDEREYQCASSTVHVTTLWQTTLFLSIKGFALERLVFGFCIGSWTTFLYFHLYPRTKKTWHYVNNGISKFFFKCVHDPIY